MKTKLILIVILVLSGCSYSESSGMRDGQQIIMHDNSGQSYIVTKAMFEIYRVTKFDVGKGTTELALKYAPGTERGEE